MHQVKIPRLHYTDNVNAGNGTLHLLMVSGIGGAEHPHMRSYAPPPKSFSEIFRVASFGMHSEAADLGALFHAPWLPCLNLKLEGLRVTFRQVSAAWNGFACSLPTLVCLGLKSHTALRIPQGQRAHLFVEG